MGRSSFALFIVLFLTVGLAQGQKSPPYDPKTGVYTIDWDTPKDQKQQKSTGNPVTPSQPAQAVPKETYKAIFPPGYLEKQKRLQDQEVAEYERRLQQKKQAAAAAAAAEQARQEAEEQRKKEMEALGRAIGRSINVHVPPVIAPPVVAPPVIIVK